MQQPLCGTGIHCSGQDQHELSPSDVDNPGDPGPIYYRGREDPDTDGVRARTRIPRGQDTGNVLGIRIVFLI